eukprot:363791-Chlamydomonas_euryale.AAC.6
MRFCRATVFVIDVADVVVVDVVVLFTSHEGLTLIHGPQWPPQRWIKSCWRFWPSECVKRHNLQRHHRLIQQLDDFPSSYRSPSFGALYTAARCTQFWHHCLKHPESALYNKCSPILDPRSWIRACASRYTAARDTAVL